MIKVSANPSKKVGYIWIPVFLSVAVHFGFFSATDSMDFSQTKPHGSSVVELQSPPPPPKPEPKREIPKPPPPPPKPVKRPPPPPKPNKIVNKEPEPLAPPPKAVFGASEDSLGKGDSNVAIRVGNTLNKEMEKKFTKPDEVKPLPDAPIRKKPAPVPIYNLTATPSFRKKVEPKFPEEVRRDGIEGTVHLELLIDETGHVKKIRVLNAPDKRLAIAAAKAAKKSLFNPGKVGEKAVSVKIKIPYRFVLTS